MTRYSGLHQVSRDEFRKSYQYYMGRADLAQVLFDSLLAKGNRLRTESYGRPYRPVTTAPGQATPSPAVPAKPPATPVTTPAKSPRTRFSPGNRPIFRDSILRTHPGLLRPRQDDRIRQVCIKKSLLSRILDQIFATTQYSCLMKKVVAGADEAIHDIPNAAVIMLGGFGLCGIPENCITALTRSGINQLTCISNNAGVDDFGLGLLLKTRQIRKMISSYVGENEEFERQLLSGELEVDLIPQGTLATRIQMAGMGIPAFFTPAGYGTEIAQGKEVREFDGKPYLMEYALHADFAMVKAWKGDTLGNLVFKKTTRNFSTSMAKAGNVTIAEVEHLVQPGELDPEHIHVPGIYVHRIFQGSNYERRIERRTVRLADSK